MKKNQIIIGYILVAVVVSWTAWAWVRFPASKTPSDKQVIEALTKQFEQQKLKEFEAGYEWCGAEPKVDLGKLLDPLNNGDFSSRPVAQ